MGQRYQGPSNSRRTRPTGCKRELHLSLGVLFDEFHSGGTLFGAVGPGCGDECRDYFRSRSAESTASVASIAKIANTTVAVLPGASITPAQPRSAT